MSEEPRLLESEESYKPSQDAGQGEARLTYANRSQIFLRPTDLEATLSAEHAARNVWGFVGRLDVSAFIAPIKARKGQPGRDAIDPKILLALWLYATSDGVGSARELDRLCKEHDAYRWICGGVPMNYHTLSDFRVGHQAALDGLFTQVLAVMLSEDLVTLTRVAQDGTRVRASAGADTFRSEEKLQKYLSQAKGQVAHVNRLAEDSTVTARVAAAQKRAATERQRRLEAALEQLPKVQAIKQRRKSKDAARVSTTDAEARVMKMGDGGFRPAYNLQFATTTAEKVIVGVGVTSCGSDKNEMLPMLAQIEQRTGTRPSEYLVDGGFTKFDAITEAQRLGTQVYAPERHDKGRAPHSPGPNDSPEVAKWRQRMATDEAKAIYKERCATAELVNADLKTHRGLSLPVRGLSKVMTLALWSALTYNMLRLAALTCS